MRVTRTHVGEHTIAPTTTGDIGERLAREKRIFYCLYVLRRASVVWTRLERWTGERRLAVGRQGPDVLEPVSGRRVEKECWEATWEAGSQPS